jgi:UDP-glucose 4-epimerase
MIQRALITGGAGFIGSHIGNKLIEKGKEVVVFDNLSVGTLDNVPKGAKFIKGDITDYKSLETAMKDCDTVFHDAAFVSIRGSFEKMRLEIDSNVIGTLNVFEAAVKSGVKKIIYASSMGVYSPPPDDHPIVNENSPNYPPSFYGFSKLRGEEYAKHFEKEFGLKTISLRYFNTYGIKQTVSPYVGVTTIFINNVLNKKPMIIFGDGLQTRDFVWVEDIAQANILAAESPVSNQVFNVGSGKSFSILDVAKWIKENIGGEIKFDTVPPGEIRHIRADITKIKSTLNYNPKGDFQKTLPKIIDWWKIKSTTK